MGLGVKGLACKGFWLFRAHGLRVGGEDEFMRRLVDVAQTLFCNDHRV